MQANETLLELWIEALCAELGEISGALITSSTAPYEANHQDAYETALLARGPVEGELYVTVEAGALVQFTQLSLGEPLDPEVACDPERIEIWRRLLDSTAGRLSAKLTANFTDSQNNSCAVVLADTRPLRDSDQLAGEPGSRIQRWLLQAGQSKIAILARVRMGFSEEMTLASQTPTIAIDDAESAQQLPVQASLDTEARNENQPDSIASTDADDHSAPEKQAISEREEAERMNTEEKKYRRASRSFDEPVISPEQAHRFDLLLDIELEATLRFGALEMPLREVLELGPGDVLSLDRHVQEPVELVVGDRIVARGEVVLVGGNFGLQVTEVAEPRRRLETIRCLF